MNLRKLSVCPTAEQIFIAKIPNSWFRYIVRKWWPTLKQWPCLGRQLVWSRSLWGQSCSVSKHLILVMFTPLCPNKQTNKSCQNKQTNKHMLLSCEPPGAWTRGEEAGPWWRRPSPLPTCSTSTDTKSENQPPPSPPPPPPQPTPLWRSFWENLGGEAQGWGGTRVRRMWGGNFFKNFSGLSKF